MYEQLLRAYEPVDGLYLRKDSTAVAALSSDNKYIGFLKIKPESRKLFNGRGIILEDCVVSARATQVCNEYLHTESRTDLLKLTPHHIKEFLKESEPNSKVTDYLDSFSKVPCEAYAIDTFANRIRNVVATANLRYSPFKRSERNALREELEHQIPRLVTDMCQLLDDIRHSSDSFASQSEEYENLIGKKIAELVNMSKEKLQALLMKNVLKKISFTATCSKVEYRINNYFEGFFRQGSRLFEYQGDFKLNC